MKDLLYASLDDDMVYPDPEIKITFCLEGKEVNLEEITDRLHLIPSSTRTPDDWPDAIKNPKYELPEELKPRYCWDYCLPYKICKAVCFRLDEIISILNGKENIINELKNKYNLRIGFAVGIHAQHDHSNLPDISLTGEIIKFMSSIDADVVFGLYLD